MRLKLGLLQDQAAIERQVQRELKEVEKKRQALTAPTVKTEAETIADQAMTAQERKEVEKHVKEAHKPPRIRPLTETKAIETGANFIAETFLFLVATTLIIAEGWRRDRKEKRQDADVASALEMAAREREEMREKMELLQAEIEALMDEKRPFDSVRAAAVASLHKPMSTAQRAATAADEANESLTGKPSEHTSTSGGQAGTVAAKPALVAPTASDSGSASPVGTSAPTAKSDGTPSSPKEITQTSTSSARTIPSNSGSTPQDSPPSSPTSWIPSSWLGSGSSKPTSDS
jgi:hypothetical protein